MTACDALPWAMAAASGSKNKLPRRVALSAPAVEPVTALRAARRFNLMRSCSGVRGANASKQPHRGDDCHARADGARGAGVGVFVAHEILCSMGGRNG
jgi:hypothetical protein